MNKAWSIVPLGQVVRHRKEFIQISDFESYKRCRVRLHAKGIVLRDIVSGADIKTKKQQVCRSGEFLVAEIDAKVGGFCIVPDDLNGAIVSSHYFLFKVNEAILDHKFLGFFIRTPTFREQISAQGSTNYAAIRPNDVLGYKIPLPPLEEQRRIVARIEQLTSRIEEAKALRQKVQKKTEVLLDIVFENILSKVNEHGWNIRPLSKVCEINPSRRGKTGYPDDLSITFVPMSAVDEKRGVISYPDIVPFARVKKGYTWFIEGDIIFARITPCMQNGKVAIATNLANGVGFGSTEFHVLRHKGEVLPEWIHRFVRRLKFRKLAEDSFKGTAGQQRVPQSFFETQHIPVPSKEDQRRIVDYLDRLQSRVDELRKHQTETQEQIDALTQSILVKAFRDEL